MHFNLTDEQRALQEMVQRFLGQEYGFEQRRRIVRSDAGWSRETWGRLAEMGLLGLHVPEEHGGMGPAPIETWVALGAMGTALLVEPYLSSAVMGTALVRTLGTAAQREALLPAMAAGETIATVLPLAGDERVLALARQVLEIEAEPPVIGLDAALAPGAPATRAGCA